MVSMFFMVLGTFTSSIVITAILEEDPWSAFAFIVLSGILFFMGCNT